MPPRSKTSGPKPASTGSTVTRSTSLSGLTAPETLNSPQSPVHSTLPELTPLNAHAAKAFLLSAGLLVSATEVSSAGLCSNLLKSIANRQGTSQTVCALLRCVDLILPEAFALVNTTNSQFDAISEKLDALLSKSDKEPDTPSPPALAELGKKLDKVTQNIQNATDIWQTVPTRTRTKSPPPTNPIGPPGPTRTDISRNRRIQSQGCFILVEPTSEALKKTFDGLTARALAQKAELAWDITWNTIKGTEVALKRKVTEKPRIAFKAALRLARGGIRYELGDRTQAALLSDAQIAAEFEKGFGGASCRGQGATILLQCAPVHFVPEDPAAIGRFEAENSLNTGDVLSMTWCKPPHKRKPEQTMAVLKLEMRSHDLADRLITEGGQLDYTRVLFRKSTQEPLRCLRCQKYGHKAANCKNGPSDVCSQCGEAHRIANCTNGDKKWCVPCQSNAHCSFDRECPTFRAERNKFNTRRPENSCALFDPSRPYDPRQRPINYPPLQLTHDMLIGGDRSSLFAAQRQDVLSLNRHSNWTSREQSRKEMGLVAIQEPYLDHLNSSRAPPGWSPIYPSLHHLKDQPRSRSFLAVSPHLSSNVWEQVSCPSPDVTALKVQTPAGPILICNVYNPCDANTSLPHISTLLRAHRGHAIVLGDFNRHHPDWDEARNAHLFTSAALNLAQPLLDLINDNTLSMALPRDIPTLQSTSTKNYTRPDNVFLSTALTESLISCNSAPASRPPCTDHFPIATTLDISPTEAPRITKRNFKKTDWTEFRRVLKEGLGNLPGLRRIGSQEEIDSRVGNMMEAIYEAVRASTPDLRLCAWSKRWWSPDLGAHRKLARSLAARSYRARFDRDDPIHEEYRLQRNRFSQAIKDAKRKHWECFLEELDEESMWTAAGYLSSEPTDGGRARVPNLRYTQPDSTPASATDNDAKSRVLMESFFPPAPPPSLADTPTPTYPTPVEEPHELQKRHIRQAVLALKPHKAPGPDGIPACVYIQSIDLLEDHLLPIFCASLRLGIYPTEWRKSRTIVLRKPGKPDYSIAKAYRPIALLNVISKILSSCVANRLNSLAEEHGWLPDHHFGGRPGRTTTDALHLLTRTIKDAWATKKVASALFLDVKGAFPHANPLRLAENMRQLGVPSIYVNWMLAKLDGRTTCLAFDDYTSLPLPIDNGIDQGCPLSVIFYLLYNAPLVKIPSPRSRELCIAYIDDVTFVVWGATFEENHRNLVAMMTREGGALEWSDTHNSTFELDKTACIDFAPPARSKQLDRPPLRIRDQVITPVKSHTLLGVIFDQTLNWREQCDKALAKGQKWAGQLNRLARMSYGTSAQTARRLYLSIAVPCFTYAADIWFMPVSVTPGKRKSGSVGFANRLARIQSTAARAILGAMKSTPVTSLDAHLDLLPMHLLMNEACQRAAIRLAAIPPSHPLYRAVAKCATGRKRYPPPLQNILQFTGVNPSNFEHRPPSRRPIPCTRPERFPDRDLATSSAWADTAHLQVFTDTAAGNLGIAAAAVLWDSDGRELRTGLRLGDAGSLSVLDAEIVGVLLAAHLVIMAQEDTIVDDVTI
ncbi:putative reverse transcriptase from transposon X-element protein [Rhizoctonia solani 123E]|uniref:Putative reverse transcriptase from transposon X-element protein n=2 Tax=Rhizoctonia solani AG-3 TaxID=1086053 RepID=A0A074RG80_9AGAM|nr:putative reverse transcriptase from transposon X-element protein [Rhizoctonia solani 123E]